MAKSYKEKIIDRFLTLYLITDSTSRTTHLLETKLQKLVFLAEKDMINNSLKGFNYYFMKFYHGPFSFELRQDLSRLVETKIVEEPYFRPAREAMMIIEDFKEMLNRNHVFFETIHNINERYASLQLDSLLEFIYSMPWGRMRDRTVGSVSQRTPMLYPMKPEKARMIFQVTEEELRDLEINLDPQYTQVLEEAMNSLKTGRLLEHEEVFG